MFATRKGTKAERCKNKAARRPRCPNLLKQGADAVKCLVVILKNRFRNAPATLGAWKIASHVLSTGGGNGTKPPPTPPSTPLAG